MLASAFWRALPGSCGSVFQGRASGRAGARLGGLEQQLNARAREVDTYVRDNPWQAVAIAGGVALLLGLIMARR